MDKTFIKNLIILALFFSAFLLVAKFTSPRSATAQTPPGMMICTTETCPDGHQVIHYCLANTNPICQFGCVTNGSCSGTLNNCTQNNTSYCQQLAGETAPGHPCTGTCDQGSGNCVSSCPYCVAQSPRPDGCGNWGCTSTQMAYVQDSNWSDNGASCNNTRLVSCQSDSSCNPPPCIPGTPGCGGQGPTHLACSGNSCVSQPGAGPPTCTTSPNSCAGSPGACLGAATPPGCGGGLCCSPECDGNCDQPDGENAGNSADCAGSSRTCGGGPGPGPGGCTPNLGQGAGCGSGQPGCCDASQGLSCRTGGSNSGTCQPPPGGGACPMPHTKLIYPIANNSNEALVIPGPNLIYGSSTNPPFRWGTNENPGASCTNGADGLWSRLYVDGQMIQHVRPPGYGYQDDPNAFDYFPNSNTWSTTNSVSTCANSVDPSMVDDHCNPQADPPGTPGGGPYTLPFTPTPGVVHTWWIEYTSPNGREGGTVRANNWTLGRFIIAGGPAAPPTPICQRDARDPYSDLCNIPDAWSFAGALRHTVSVLDNGPDNTKTYLHNFTILDNTNPAAPPIQINNVPGLGGSVVPAQIPLSSLTLGHKYEWFANSTDPGTPPTSADSSPHWFFTYDNTGPTIVPGMTYARCYATPQGANNPPPLQIFATDTSGIQSASVTISNNGPLVNIPLTFISGDALKNGTYAAPWPALTVGGTYSVLGASANDNAGNPNTIVTPNLTFLFSSVCTSPWLQTQQGDVHSNVNVKTPGGP